MINRPYAVTVALIRIWLLGLAAQITISASVAAQSPRRREPGAIAYGPAKRDCLGSQRLSAVRGWQGGGLCPRQFRLRQGNTQKT